jgi:imidazole glycerol phosphate synthase glutamine amidotransferase subunit
MRIGLVDYGAGNQQSVRNALRSLGLESTAVADARGLEDVDALIFPGVGAFGDTMRQLHERGLGGPLRAWIDGGRPFLGICIGYQVLFDASVESPGVPGLSVFPGMVVGIDSPGLKIPHMGWNVVEFQRPDDPLWLGLGPSPHFYFVHSFHPVPADPGLVAATTSYGTPFASAIRWPTGAAVQFHPEKSQSAGLRLLRNFADLSRESLAAGGVATVRA